MKMKAIEKFFASAMCKYQKYRASVAVAATDASSSRKKKRKKWRTKAARSHVLLFAFSVLLSSCSSVSSHSGDKNWKTNADNSVISETGAKNFNDDDTFTPPPVDGELDGKGGTRWASAKEEANDERRDAEIFQAVLNSVAELEERRRKKHQTKKKHKKRREKRSQQEKSEKSEDDDDDDGGGGGGDDDDAEEDKEPVRVCYEELGCFQEAGYIDLLPNSPEEVNTRYLLYNSRKSRGDTPLLDVSAQNISSLWEWAGKAFNVSAPTKVIVHGFGSSCSNVWVYEMRSALMSVEDCNIICVDWEAGATIPNYVRAAANTRLVGKQVAILLSGLEKYVNLSVRNVHVIGFSLGAHVAGFAGSELKNLSRITGLDPAGPLFESQDRRARLDSLDAQFVDVIHSNGENLILGGLGAWQPMGHVDFYPNGGRMQKGCTNLFVGAVSDMIWSANEVYGRSLCNHRRAYKFFTDSVSAKCQFPAVPCESYDHFLEGKCFPCQNIRNCNNMGYYSDKFAGRGTLYLLTRDEEPFCANQYMVKVENSAEKESTPDGTNKLTTFGKIQITLIGDLELNETYVITQKKDEKLVSGESVSRIIVPHPALQNFLKIQILYVAYKGWLSSGHAKWKINKISLTNSYGQVLSACKEDLVLESGVPVVLHLIPKNCDVNEHTVDNNRTSKPTIHDAEVDRYSPAYQQNQSLSGVYPHTQVVRIGNEILTTKEPTLTLAPNPPEEWTNASALKKHDKHNLNGATLPDNSNMTNIGVGVTEYLNDPWKQKADFFETATVVHVLNNLDGVGDERGEARRLVFKSAKMDNVSASSSARPIAQFAAAITTKPPSQIMTIVNAKTPVVVAVAATATAEKPPSPYEFVTAARTPSEMTVVNAGGAPNSESKITEPVLKPKASSMPHSVRSRKSQNAYRPNYAKSINVNNEWHTTPISEVTAGAGAGAGKKLAVLASTTSNYGNASIAAANAPNARVTVADDDASSGRSDSGGERTSTSKRANEAAKNASSLFVVQFLPQKLVSFFEQAERYARLAFMPFISAPLPENAKSGVERTRRVRTFNNAAGRWSPSSAPPMKEPTNDRSFDLELEESRNVASIVAAPAALRVTSASFPYAYQVQQQHLWQPIAQFADQDYKYIPLTSGESNARPRKPSALRNSPRTAEDEAKR